MHRLALILLIYPLASLADTFELSDPAAEIYQEQQNPPEKPKEPEKDAIVIEELFCAVDETDGKCWCVHKETAKVVVIEHEQCIVHASGTSPTREP